eukprot:1750007-Rhodomonas_salina.1
MSTLIVDAVAEGWQRSLMRCRAKVDRAVVLEVVDQKLLLGPVSYDLRREGAKGGKRNSGMSDGEREGADGEREGERARARGSQHRHRGPDKARAATNAETGHRS